MSKILFLGTKIDVKRVFLCARVLKFKAEIVILLTPWRGCHFVRLVLSAGTLGGLLERPPFSERKLEIETF